MASSEGRGWLLTIRHSLFAIRPLGSFSSQLLALLDGFFDGADHIERRFRQMIVLAFADRAEAFDGILQIDELAGRTCTRWNHADPRLDKCHFPRSRGSTPWWRPDGRTRWRAPGRSSRRPARRSPAPK